MSRTQTFGQMNFAGAKLGDARRTKRLVKVADQLARHPGGTLPHKLNSPHDLKALYRLCECQQVTHEAILAAHREQTLQRIAEHQGEVLVIHDSTELDYTAMKSLAADLGQIGSGKGRGFICQNSLAVDAKTGEVQGLVNQVLHCRDQAPENETKEQSRSRESRESRLWMRGTEGLPGRSTIADVCDRGADTFEFLEHELRSGRRFVIRARHDRAILTGHDDSQTATCRLFSYLREQPSMGTRKIKVQEPRTQPRREATLAISAAPVRLVAPKQKRGEHGDEPLPLWCVRAWEIDPPPEVTKPLEWFLFTADPADSFAKAERTHRAYEKRWIVEEYHKGMKTGCGIEQLQFRHVEQLQPAIAVISVVALTLLSLRDRSRRDDAKTTPATELFSEEYIEVLSRWRWNQVRTDVTIHDFLYALARLGGHQNRKHDHPPGWLVR